MKCISPLTIKSKIRQAYITVPCGQCFACRVNKTSEWTFRLMLELTDWDDACFITLTYDDEHMDSQSLDYDHLQLFWKRLRKALGKDRKIKYYACGEYGDESGRRHFHAIVFGLPYNNETRLLLTKVWKYCDPLRFLYDSKGVAPVTIDDIAYVAGYCQKKLNGDLGKKAYEDKGLLPPQSRCSRYLGYNAFSKNVEQIRAYGCVFWNGTKLPVPRYFRNKFSIDVHPDSDLIKEKAKIVYGDDYDEEAYHYYVHVYLTGLLSYSYEKKLESTNEQRRLDHLAAVRAKRSFINSKRMYNGKERLKDESI